MGCVQQAVLEFDEEVRAPWRPRLVSELPIEQPARELESARTVPTHPSRRGVSQVGACRSPVGAVRSAAAVAGTTAARVGRGVGARRSRGRLRLTRRARRLALVLALAAGIALGAWLAPLLGAGSGLRLAGQTSVVVRPGDTLWSIASPVARDGDVRAVVDEIRQLNSLSSAALVPGQTLRLP